MKDFKDKVVVITGGATGIGLSFAKKFGIEGAKVVISGRRENRLQEAVKELNDIGIEAKYFQCDVIQRQEVEDLADFSWDAFGCVDVIVNNAGTSGTLRIPLIDIPPEEFRKIYDVNIFGVVNGAAVFGKRFIKQGTPAAIYNVGSENSFFNASRMAAPYISSKHAILAITVSLREEVPEFIEVGLICPGFTRSELVDPAANRFAMDTDTFTEMAMEQMKNSEFFIVSHAYNIVRINDRHDEIVKAYERYAPRYEGDEEFDVRTLLAKFSRTTENN